MVKWAASLIIIMVLGALVYYYFDNRPAAKADEKAAQETNDSSGTKTDLVVPSDKIQSNSAVKASDPVQVPVIADGKIPFGKEIKSRELIEPSSTVVYLPNEVGTYNASVACKIIAAYNNGGGFVIKPGEVFSYNKALGERTKKKGFIDGYIPIVNPDGSITYKLDIASGICRLSVGLATAATRAGLDTITYPFTKHAHRPSYLNNPKNAGLVDATVYDDQIDNKFVNDKSYDIQINCGVDSSCRLWVKFYKITYKT
jgi:hypothetical protein